MNDEQKFACFIGAVILVIALAIAGGCSWTSVPAGQVAVVTSFGEPQGEPLEAGFHWLGFWKKANDISIQTQEAKEHMTVPTVDGLMVELEASLIFAVSKDQALPLYKNVGLNYKEVVVLPQFRSALRGVTAKYKPEDLYAARRTEMEGELEKATRVALAEHGVLCEHVLLRNIKLPDTVTNAIQNKLASQQEAAAMEFIILKAVKEAERKRAEAKGIADYQSTVQVTLTEQYLRYAWIKALEESAKHGATMIYIPTGGDGLPVFREVDKGPRKIGEK